MRKKRLGRTGLEVSACCLGTMTFGEQVSEADTHRLLDRALDAGVDFLDAAEMYPIPPKAETQGRTEAFLGSWLRARKNRDRLVIATKVSGRGDSRWLRSDGAGTELSRGQIREAVEASLTRLGTDWIDLYQVHWPDRTVSQWGSNPTIFRERSGPEIAIEETLGALAELVREGKIRFVGLSNESAWGTMRYLAASEANGAPRVQSIQNAYSLVNRTFEVNLAEVALREDVPLLAYSPLAQGFLSGKYRHGALPAGSRKALFNRQQRYEKPGAAQAFDAYCDLAAELGLDPAQMALRFVDTRPFVGSTIIGVTTMQQLETDLAAFDLAWTPEIEERIDAIHMLRGNPCP
jgi:aryl-alcohol dehydrogenase-like predicted oxidoreductase